MVVMEDNYYNGQKVICLALACIRLPPCLVLCGIYWPTLLWSQSVRVHGIIKLWCVIKASLNYYGFVKKAILPW